MSLPTPAGVRVLLPAVADAAAARVLTPEALAFLADLHRTFEPRRRTLLAARAARQARLAAGERPGLRADTTAIRDDASWRVAPAGPGLDDRRVEITGPVERKMMINALNSGATVFMADFEDATAPTWRNVIDGQVNCMDAVRRTIAYTAPDGRAYALGATTATLVVRPRGWHLDERHLEVDGAPMSGALVDAGLYLFHNARESVTRGAGPYFYLPKLEAAEEARLWNDVFVHAQAALGVPRGTVRATVLIETILAAFEMEELLFELREHAAGLNAGRWDYIFSVIKKFGDDPAFVLPDRAQVTMTVPFMRAYAERLVDTCHRRGAHAIGGMAAFIPNRRDAEVTARAIAKVTEDKQREAGQGFDGTWVAHPDLVPVARAAFDAALGERPHQKPVVAAAGALAPVAALLDCAVPGGAVTVAGFRANVDVALRYLEAWLGGAGAVAIHDLMEDAATAEISRAQLWQWIRHGTTLDDGTIATAAHYRAVRDEVVRALAAGRALDSGALAAAIDTDDPVDG
ncbi:MAG: malate synthase A, partial [Gemmatimonadaceae bacterium]|nr:malate synthase A [Gemmatimonadaceae bacterium]